MESHTEVAPQVIAVAAAPGRPGPQALAPNLAVRAGMRGRQTNRKVCFLDATGSLLEQHAAMEVPDLADLPPGPLRTEDLDALLVHHGVWNLHLLQGRPDAEDPDSEERPTRFREVLVELRKRFDVTLVATSVLELYSPWAEELLAEADQLCLEVPDNMATVLNVGMWVRSWRAGREPGSTRPRLGFVFTPRGDGHLTVTGARAELSGVRELGRLPNPNRSRSVDPTVLAAAGPDPVMGTALDTALFEITRDVAFKPRRNEWWRY
jgi:hypothetical protein